jgi:hypothetical protein
MRLIFENFNPFNTLSNSFEFFIPLYCDSYIHLHADETVATHMADPYADYSLFLHPLLALNTCEMAERALDESSIPAHLVHNASHELCLYLTYIPAPVLAASEVLPLQAGLDIC